MWNLALAHFSGIPLGPLPPGCCDRSLATLFCSVETSGLGIVTPTLFGFVVSAFGVLYKRRKERIKKAIPTLISWSVSPMFVSSIFKVPGPRFKFWSILRVFAINQGENFIVLHSFREDVSMRQLLRNVFRGSAVNRCVVPRFEWGINGSVCSPPALTIWQGSAPAFLASVKLRWRIGRKGFYLPLSPCASSPHINTTIQPISNAYDLFLNVFFFGIILNKGLFTCYLKSYTWLKVGEANCFLRSFSLWKFLTGSPPHLISEKYMGAAEGSGMGGYWGEQHWGFKWEISSFLWIFYF